MKFKVGDRIRCIDSLTAVNGLVGTVVTVYEQPVASPYKVIFDTNIRGYDFADVILKEDEMEFLYNPGEQLVFDFMK